MTTPFVAALAIILLVWLASGFRDGRLDWLERRTGLEDRLPGNATSDRDI